MEYKCDRDSLLKYIQYDYQNTYEKLDTFLFIQNNETTISENMQLIEMEYYTKPGK
ncbi:MAG: hypothetical protein ACPKQO_11195 [Nitrososphaeraceae archaeon]